MEPPHEVTAGLHLQAMRDTELAASVQECCTLIGCFVPCQDHMPLIMTHLAMAADPAAEAAALTVLTSLIRGAGKLILLPVGSITCK